MSKLLINEPPLQVLPSLAVAIGLNEALFLQQLHYWLQRSGHDHDGQRWVYNTYDGWIEQFPFWSGRTIQRVVNSLRTKGVVTTTDQYNKLKIDNTLWYTIEYEQLDNLAATSNQMVRPSRQVVQTETTSCLDQDDNLSTPLPETTSETTTETTTTTEASGGTRQTDPEYAIVCERYEQEIGLLSSVIADNLKDLLAEYGQRPICDAISIAVKANKRSLRYVEGILKKWKADGRDSPHDHKPVDLVPVVMGPAINNPWRH